MNPKKTWTLVVCAVLLFVFITLLERRTQVQQDASQPSRRELANLNPSQANVVEILLRTNQIFRAERTNEDWMLVAPVQYPAYTTRIEYLINVCSQLKRQAQITASELQSQHQSLSAFGLDPPQANLIIYQGPARYELRVGGLTPVGDQVYVQVVGEDGIYFTDAALLERLPKTADDWRDPSFLRLKKVNFNRLEVRSGATGFQVQIDPSTQLWRLTHPMVARANNQKLGLLLLQLLDWQVDRFLPDQPQTDWESYGLQPPESVLVFGQGTNDLVAVQFGKSPTNAPSLVYARGQPPMNLVLVPRKTLDLLRENYAKFREPRLVSVPLNRVQLLEIRGPENFVLQQGEGGWWFVQPRRMPADAELVQQFLGDLSNLEINEFVKDVVTDFSTYGLANPTRQYTLRTLQTNSLTGITNPVVAQVSFGATQGDLLYARLSDENSVYSVNSRLAQRLSAQMFQFRDRHLWKFGSTNVQTFTLTVGNDTRKFVRNGSGRWLASPANIPLDEPISMLLEETLHRIGQLKAEAWVSLGGDQLARHGFPEAAHRITMELLLDGKPQLISIDFGSMSPSRNQYAAFSREGQTLIFEFPLSLYELYVEFLRHLPPVPPRAP
jgi:hypothetical protein